MNGLQPFESTIEQTTETMPPSHKTITAAVMTTNRITSLRELLHKALERKVLNEHKNK